METKMTEWVDFYGNSITINDFFSKYDRHNQMIIVGTDSQKTRSGNRRYTTAIVCYKEKRGASCIHHTVTERNSFNLHEQLLKETWYSVTAALDVMSLAPESVPNIVSIHLDVNVNPKDASTKYKNELVGMVLAQGFEAVTKPDSWAATHLADHIVRDKIKEK
jgi:predicted RNase H-related nuclease YkuK (DUF458 family)